MNDSILDASAAFENKALKVEIDRLTEENVRLKMVIQESGLEYNIAQISPEECLLLREINRLNEISETNGLDLELTKQFDILFKNLTTLRNGRARAGKPSQTKKFSTEELIRLAGEE